jgi:biotin transporter BioY
MFHLIALKICIAAACGFLPGHILTAIITGAAYFHQQFRGYHSHKFRIHVTCTLLLIIFGSFPLNVCGWEATLLPFLFLLIVNKSARGAAFVFFPLQMVCQLKFVVQGCRDERKFNRRLG